MLSQVHMVAPLYRYTVQVGPRFGDSGSLRSENNAITSCLKLIFTSDHFIHFHMTYKSAWAIGMLSEGHMVAHLYHYTSQVAPRFGDSGSLEKWK
jgi:hypothetical protein